MVPSFVIRLAVHHRPATRQFPPLCLTEMARRKKISIERRSKENG